MQINDLSEYGMEELNYFRCLTNSEKIEFLDSVCMTGVAETLNVFLAGEFTDTLQAPNMIQTIDFRGLGVVQVVIYDNEMYLHSNSLKALRLYIQQLFSAGHVLYRLPVKKPKEITDRYYFCFDILSNNTPICLN